MSSWTSSKCPLHGRPIYRADCGQCNAAYMKDYQRRRRVEMPSQPLHERARKRALMQGLEFSLSRADILVPSICPVLGIPIIIGGKRSERSPSLDRIDPSQGYVPGNVRVISDKANRLKGRRSLQHLLDLAEHGSIALREDYRKVADYVRREELLRELRMKAFRRGSAAADLRRLVPILDRIFALGLVEETRDLTQADLECSSSN